MNMNMITERIMIQKKIKCLHCNSEVICSDAINESKCSCGKNVINRTMIVEGVQGTDYIDVTPVLLNE
jgi:hypothetical protein